MQQKNKADMAKLAVIFRLQWCLYGKQCDARLGTSAPVVQARIEAL